MKLPQGLPLAQTTNTWASAIEPTLNAPIVQGTLLNDIPLVVGTTQVSHRLGRKLRGWIIVGVTGIAQIYDSQATNNTPQLTLNLVSDSVVTVNLWVF